MKPIFHTFEAHDRKVTLCAVIHDRNIFLSSAHRQIMVGIAILNPIDKDKVVTIDGVERNYGELVAQGRAEKCKGKVIHAVTIHKEFIHKNLVNSLLKSIEVQFKRNPENYIAALR